MRHLQPPSGARLTPEPSLVQGGQDILSMMGQLMKPKKTEITGETRRSAGPSLAACGVLPLLTAGAALGPLAHPERETGAPARPACSALPARPRGPGLPPRVRPQAGCPFGASD